MAKQQSMTPVLTSLQKSNFEYPDDIYFTIYADGNGGNWMLVRTGGQDENTVYGAGEYYEYTPQDQQKSARRGKMQHEECMNLNSAFFNYGTFHIFKGFNQMSQKQNSFISLFQGNGTALTYFNTNTDQGVFYSQAPSDHFDKAGALNCHRITSIKNIKLPSPDYPSLAVNGF